MQKCLITILTIVLASFLGLNSNAAIAAPYSATKGAVITVPEGQVLRAIVTTPLSSNCLSLGQNVTMVLGEDFYYNNKLVAPVDSVVFGSVIKVSKASKNSDGELLLRFTRITTPYGIQVPISAIIKNSSKIGNLSGEHETSESNGGDVDIPVNTPVDLVLIQPITVNPEVYNPNY